MNRTFKINDLFRINYFDFEGIFEERLESSNLAFIAYHFSLNSCKIRILLFSKHRKYKLFNQYYLRDSDNIY